MAFKQFLEMYIKAEVGDNKEVGSLLPVSGSARTRATRLGGIGYAREWRIVVSDQAAEVRKAIALNRPQAILATEVEHLLYLIGERDERGRATIDD